MDTFVIERRITLSMKYKLLAIILMAATINSCGAGSSQNAKAQTAASETKVLIKTTVGDITIKLYMYALVRWRMESRCSADSYVARSSRIFTSGFSGLYSGCSIPKE